MKNPTSTNPSTSQSPESTLPLRTLYFPHPRVTAPVGEHSLTIQSAKAECDINNILSQYQRTGIVTHVTKNRPSYEDLPDAIDYQESMNTLLEAQAAFAGLPAKVRDFYGNDPLRLLVALHDPEQHAQLREFGVLNQLPKVEPPAPTPPLTPPAAS